MVIPDESAERCMRLLEMWLDDNEDANIVCDLIGGKHKMRIERRGKVRNCLECPECVTIDNIPNRCVIGNDPRTCERWGKDGKEQVPGL